ncbi:MAG: hypothetical protein AB8H79_17945 [Myxococcota bacterium]
MGGPVPEPKRYFLPELGSAPAPEPDFAAFLAFFLAFFSLVVSFLG